MKNHILKLALGALILAALGFVGYRFIQNRDNVEIQSAKSTYQDRLEDPTIYAIAPAPVIESSIKYKATGA